MDTHQTTIRTKHGLCTISCTCGWSEQAVSNFGAWLVSRRHLDETSPGGRAEGVPLPPPLTGAKRRRGRSARARTSRARVL